MNWSLATGEKWGKTFFCCIIFHSLIYIRCGILDYQKLGFLTTDIQKYTRKPNRGQILKTMDFGEKTHHQLKPITSLHIASKWWVWLTSEPILTSQPVVFMLCEINNCESGIKAVSWPSSAYWNMVWTDITQKE